MKLLNIVPENLNKELALKIYRNTELKREYIKKYDLMKGGGGRDDC